MSEGASLRGQSLASISSNGSNRSVATETGTPTPPSSAFSITTTLTSVEQTTTETVSYPTDCSGFNIPVGLNDIHTLYLHDSDNKTALVNCLSTDDGLWTVIQRRFDGSVDFYRNWTDYKEGFGDASGEYWLGNEALYQLTSRSSYRLKVVLKAWDNMTAYAMYDTFHISNESDGYRLNIGGYTGDAGDSMVPHNGQMFSTLDRDNDRTGGSCATDNIGAWWYNNCYASNLNGHYFHYEVDWTVKGRITWFSFKAGISLKETAMMIQTI